MRRGRGGIAAEEADDPDHGEVEGVGRREPRAVEAERRAEGVAARVPAVVEDQPHLHQDGRRVTRQRQRGAGAPVPEPQRLHGRDERQHDGDRRAGEGVEARAGGGRGHAGSMPGARLPSVAPRRGRAERTRSRGGQDHPPQWAVASPRDRTEWTRCTTATTTAPTTRPRKAEPTVLVTQPRTPPRAPVASCTASSRWCTHAYGRVQAEVVEAHEQDVAAHPDHRGDADGGQRREHGGHRPDQAVAEASSGAGLLLRQVQADVVHLHDERDHAVDQDGDREGDDDEDDGPAEEGLVGDLVERDDHDLGGQDEVGADRAAGDRPSRRRPRPRRAGSPSSWCPSFSQIFSAPSKQR